MRWRQLRNRDADLERELQSDLELEEEEQRERGLSPEEARHAARRALARTSVLFLPETFLRRRLPSGPDLRLTTPRHRPRQCRWLSGSRHSPE